MGRPPPEPVWSLSALTFDESLRAFDTRDGQELWKGELPTSARATPLVYTDCATAQMVAIMAGGHDSPVSRIDNKLVVFALGISVAVEWPAVIVQ